MLKKTALGGLAVALGFLLVTNPVVAEAAKLVTGKNIKNNSVTTKDIKNNNLTTKDIKNNNLTGQDIKNGKITAADLDSATVSSLQSPSYKFTLPQDLPATASKTFSFPGIDPGLYLATYSVISNGSSVLALQCVMNANATSTDNEAFNWGVIQGGDSAVSASTVLQLTSAPPELTCSSFGGGTWTPFPGAFKSTVTFTRVDPEPSGAVVVSRHSTAKAGPGAR